MISPFQKMTNRDVALHRRLAEPRTPALEQSYCFVSRSRECWTGFLIGNLDVLHRHVGDHECRT